MLGPLLEVAQTACDRLFEFKRYPEPISHMAGNPSVTPITSAAHLKPKLIAHRGAWDHHTKIENTLPAFVEAQRLGAWGIEFDVRFSRDGAAVICHDPNLQRCFNKNENVYDLNARDLPSEICHLENVLDLSGLHFMIEIKCPLSVGEVAVLHEKLKHLTPVEDYHLLALAPELVRVTPQLPAAAWILVGEMRTSHLIGESLRRQLGGVAGHYALMTEDKIKALHRAHQFVGTGFLPSQNLFNREWSRRVDWVFTNSLGALVPPT